MAVYKRAYRPYEGRLTAERWRFLAIPRFAFAELFESRLLTAFVVLCFVPFAVEAAAVYVMNSPPARALLGISGDLPGDFPNAWFFLQTLTVQAALACGLTAWVAPLLVSPDLVNGALPLYLSRPLARGDYVLGKAAVLAALLSAVTWVPGLLLFGLQAGVAGPAWLGAHARLPFAIVVGSALWVLVLTLLGLAISAWIRWRLVASAALFAVFFIGTAFGEVWREVLRNPWGRLTNLFYMVGIVWRDLFGVVPRRSLAREMLDDRRAGDLPVWAAWLALLAVSGLCLWLLDRRLRAREVSA